MCAASRSMMPGALNTTLRYLQLRFVYVKLYIIIFGCSRFVKLATELLHNSADFFPIGLTPFCRIPSGQPNSLLESPVI